MNKKRISRALIMFLGISIIVSVCGCSRLLQQVFADYITINLDNGILLSESENNEQVCTYQIDATVTNNYSIDLSRATVVLSIPANAEVSSEGDKSTIEGVNLTLGESVSYSWIVKIPKTYENQNIEYNVTVSSENTEPIIAYASVFVKGKNENDNRLSFARDTWRFKNFKSKPVCLTQDDYDAFLVGLDNASIGFINDIIKGGSKGYCYGFAASTILVKMDALEVEDIDSTKSILHDVKSGKKSKSVLAYYWLTQYFTGVIDERADFNQKSLSERISIIEEKAKAVLSGGSPFIFSFYTKPNGEGGHAVVAYAQENGQFNKGGRMFDSRILIYDSNYPKWDEDSCLYYNSGTSEWYIPNYPESSDITRALSDINIMNIKNLEDNRKSANTYLNIKGGDEFSVHSGDGLLSAVISGTNVEGNNEGITAMRMDSNDDILIVTIPKNDIEDIYTIQSNDNNALDISVKYDSYYMSAASTSNNPITFNPNGSVSIENEVSDFEISIVANNRCYSTDWYNVSIKGENGQNPQLSVCDEGYLISGDSFNNLEVYVDNGNSAEILNIQSSDNTVLLTQTGENLCAKVDDDSDGTFEQVLGVGKSIEPRDPLSDASSFKWWIIPIIVGGVILIVVAAIILRKLLGGKSTGHRSVNKKNKKNSSDEEWWN